MESLVFKTQSERNIGKQRRSRSCGNYLNFGCTDFTCRYIQISAHESGRDDFREDYKREQRYLKGEVTVYLSLVFILLISFAGAMLESASLQNVKNYRRADMTRAVESIFAEYQKELWEVYGIFALEGSYETGSYSEELLKERLAYYGASGMDQEITRIQLLTDQGASAFYEQVTAYMENKYGLDKVKKLVGQTDTWKAGEEALQNYERDGAKTEQELQELLSQKEEFPEEENPLSHVAKLKSMPLVDLIMPKGRVMSKKSITLSEMVSHRKRNQGYGDFSDVAGSGSTISKLLFGEYVLEHFKMASDSLQSGSGNYNNGDSVGGILSVEILLMKTSAMEIGVTWQVRGVWTMNWNIFWKVTPATEKIWRRLPVSFLWSDLCRIMRISRRIRKRKQKPRRQRLHYVR